MLSVPLYQGGSEYSAVRQARQTEQAQRKTLDDARRTAVQTAVSAWETLVAARATIASTRAQIKANEVALEGVEREALVGSRTTLDVLNAEQALLTSRVTLVQNLASLVTASYGVAVGGRAPDRARPQSATCRSTTTPRITTPCATGCGAPATTPPTSRGAERGRSQSAERLTEAWRAAPGGCRVRGGADPSMEDILASIRRILSEEETQPPAPCRRSPNPGAGVLVLDPSMLVAEEPHVEKQAEPAPPATAAGTAAAAGPRRDAGAARVRAGRRPGGTRSGGGGGAVGRRAGAPARRRTRHARSRAAAPRSRTSCARRCARC